MKSIVLLFILLSLKLCGQTVEEKILFEEINKYRETKRLNPIKWDSSLYKMSSHHTKYLCIISSPPYNKRIMTHDEVVLDVPGFEEIYTTEDRLLKFFGHKNCIENCAILNVGNMEPRDISIEILDMWIYSPMHEEKMVIEKSIFGACSIQYYEMEMNYTNKNGKVKKKKVKTAACTLNIY